MSPTSADVPSAVNNGPESGPVRPESLTRANNLPSAGAAAADMFRQFVTRRLRSRKRRPVYADIPLMPVLIQPLPETPEQENNEGLAVPTLKDVLGNVFMPQDASQDLEDPSLEYDNIRPYLHPDGCEVEERERVVYEIKRLLDVLESPDTPLLLRNCPRLEKLKGTSVGYRALDLITAILWEGWRICGLDNYGVSMLHCPIKNPSPTELQRIMKKIRTRCSPERVAIHMRNIFTLKDEEDGSPVWPRYNEFVEDAKAVIDLITESIARFFTQIALGVSWRNHQLAAIARFSAKLKVLIRDIEASAITSLDIASQVFDKALGVNSDGEESVSRPGVMEQIEDIGTTFQAERGRFGQPDHVYGNDDDDDDGTPLKSAYTYWFEQQRAREGLMMAFDCVLFLLYTGDNHPGYGITEFEICGFVMETGFHEKTLIYQDRDFEYSGTSDPDHLNIAHAAFRMLNAALRHLHEHRTCTTSLQPPAPSPSVSNASPPGSASETKTIIEWSYSLLDSPISQEGAQGNRSFNRKSVNTGEIVYELKNMKEIITVLVPLALASPMGTTISRQFLELFYGTLRDPNDVLKLAAEDSFTAFVRLYTTDFEKTYRKLHPPDVQQLASLVKEDRFSYVSLLEVESPKLEPAKNGVQSETEAKKFREEREKELARCHDLMDAWVYTEDAVIVPCGRYVWTVIAGVSTLVGGGMAIGLSVGERIEGVDPFNITMFVWAVAALVLLICKASLVEHWSWNDFLHQRVKCRSVSELQAVTGIPDQLIIARLLHDEKDSILKTRGPFNTIFLNKAADGVTGFSIDVPVRNKTLLLSGLVMIKVETCLGHAVVCLDARRGKQFTTVSHREVDTDQEWLMCPSIDRLAHNFATKQSARRRYPLKKGQLNWRKVEGVYNALDAEFV